VVAVHASPSTSSKAFEDVIDDLAACPGVLCLIPARKSGDAITGVGGWLSRRLGRPVIAPEGRATPVPGGLYVPPGAGAGWLRFDADGDCVPHSRRFPRPSWDCPPLSEPRTLVEGCALDPLPAGGWIRAAVDSPDVVAFRRWLIGSVAPHPLLPRVVLGYPGSPLPPIAAVVQFVRSLPAGLQPGVRLAGFGGSDEGLASFGQALADALDAPVALGDGVQMSRASSQGGFEVRTVLRAGMMAWSPFVSDLGYLPTRSTGGVAARPAALGHRAPIAGLPELEPGVYEYSHDAVLEVTQSGLWMRPPIAPSDGAAVRAVQADVTHAKVVYAADTDATALRMSSLASEMVERLEPQLRAAVRIVASTEIDVSTEVHNGSPMSTEGGTSPALWDAEADDAGISVPAALSYARSADAPRALTARVAPVAEGSEPSQARSAAPVPPAVALYVSSPSSAGAVGTEQQVGLLGRMVTTETDVPTMSAWRPPVLAAAIDAHFAAPDPAVGPESTAAVDSVAFAKVRVASEAAAVEDLTAVGDTTVQDPAQPATSVPAARTASQATAEPEDPIRYVAFPLTSSDADLSLDLARVPADPAPEAEPAPVTPAPASAQELPPSAFGGAAISGAPLVRADRHRSMTPGLRVQPVPTAATSVDPRERDLERERAWLRRNFGKHYDAATSSVARILSENPGLRRGGSASDSDVLSDLVAVRLYLTNVVQGLDDAVRDAKTGPHVSLARCVASGLRRLPSYRGPLWTRAQLTDEQVRWYGGLSKLTEWSFLPALASASLYLPGSADFLIWSTTARRAELIDPSLPGLAVFLPGTSFKVLSVGEGSDGPEVRLRELTPAEAAPDKSLRSMQALDEFAAAALEEVVERRRQGDPRQQLPEDRRNRFAAAPGLLADPAVAGVLRWAQEGGNR
jgi:hypothetical protein